MPHCVCSTWTFAVPESATMDWSIFGSCTMTLGFARRLNQPWFSLPMSCSLRKMPTVADIQDLTGDFVARVRPEVLPLLLS